MHTLTNSRNDLEQAIAQGIDFLHAMQLPSGSISDVLLARIRSWKKSANRITRLFRPLKSRTASISQNRKRAEEIVRKAIRFLVNAMQDGCVWRYTCSP